MGIQGLLPLLKSIQKPVSIGADFSGQVIGVDTYCWLHKGAYGCAMELVEGKKSPMYVNYVLKRVDMLMHFNVKPILVFDGSYLPSKAGQEARRRKTRQENKAKGLAFLRSGNRQQAFECFQKCVDITPEMALEVIKECRKKGVDCIVAPYEADAQLAYLMKSGITQAIISEDSDLLVYGCQKVIFKMDACGHGVAVDLADLSKLTNLKLHEFSQEKFRHMCILSGCDYLPSIKGVGLQTAIKLLRKSSCVYKLIRSLRLDSKMQVPADYEKNFKQADETFLYQLVFDPISTSLVPLNQLPDGIKPGDLEFAGPFMSAEKALGIALGNINPNSGEVIADFNPKKTKVFTRGGGDEPCSDDDNCGSRALTPDPVSSWGYSVMSKRGKTEYDVQKSLSGLMLNSQSSAKSKKPFVPPGQKRKANEDGLDDDSLATMYTSLKTRPRPMLRHARTVPGHAKRSRYKNPFRVGDQETETKDTRGELSRYFNMVRNPESLSKCSSNGTDKPDQRPPEERLEIGDEDTGIGNISEPGALLSAAAENVTDSLLTDSETKNCTIDIEQNKENELRTSDFSIAGHFTVVEKVECLENSREEVADCHRGLPQKMARSPRKPANPQCVLTNHSVNRSDTKLDKPAHTNLTDRFGYKRSFKAMEEKPGSKECASVAPVTVIDIDSGYLSEGETSMDCGTPSSTPTLPCLPRLIPPSSEGNLARLLKQGSAVGTKTMQHQIQLKSKTGVRSSGLGRCRSMGITRKKSKQNISKESSSSDASSTLLSYFAFDRHKKPRLEDNQSESSNS